MELVKITERNKKYFSEDFIKGFNTGASRQYQHDTAEKTGKWIFNPHDGVEAMFTKPKCSVCGFESADGLNYCPNCGARMVEDD